MLDLLTTEAFADWWKGLASGPAEDVAAALEVIVQLGTRADAPGSTDWLLWYQHPLLTEGAVGLSEPAQRMSSEFLQFTREWGAFNGYVRRVTKHLESAQFLACLARLQPADAEVVAAAVNRIRRIAKRRLFAMSDHHRKHARYARRPGSERELESLLRLCDVTEVREAYLSALAAAGFEVIDLPAQSSVLRELTLRATPPGLRVLYGIDAAKSRGLVVLGEWLDRSYYGDSVRTAEALWGQFLSGQPLPTQPADAR
jgi:hypothetical protein